MGLLEEGGSQSREDEVWQKVLMSWLEVTYVGQLAVNESDLLSSLCPRLLQP